MGEAKRKQGREPDGFGREVVAGELLLRILTEGREPIEARFPARSVAHDLATLDGPMSRVVATIGGARERHDARIGAMLETADLLHGARGARLPDGRQAIHAFCTMLWIAATQSEAFREALLRRCGEDERVVLTVFLDDPPTVLTTLSDAVNDVVPRDAVAPGETRVGRMVLPSDDATVH